MKYSFSLTKKIIKWRKKVISKTIASKVMQAKFSNLYLLQNAESEDGSIAIRPQHKFAAY